MISFADTTNYSKCIDENEYFKHFYNQQAHFRYDSNFFKLKYQPTLEEFKLIEEMQLSFNEDVGLHHIKFYWPDNTGFTPPIFGYFQDQNYELEYLELYQIDPNAFQPTRKNSEVVVSYVTEDSLKDFKRMSYTQDLDFGKDFAQSKQDFYDWQYKNTNIKLLLATINQKAVGTLTMVLSDETIEIDDVSTVECYRNQAVATMLQTFVMNEAIKQEKSVILIADGEDTPKNMYQRQGYSYIAYQLGAQKVLDERRISFE